MRVAFALAILIGTTWTALAGSNGPYIVIPGRPGYWLDLGLVMLAVYLVGCAVGSWLRDRVLSRHAPAA